MSPVPRRRFLSGLAATTGVVASAGCLDSLQRTKYTLFTSPVADSVAELTETFVVTDPTEITAQEAMDYSDGYKQSVVDALFEDGSAEAVQWELAYDHPFGTTTRPAPRFLQHDGAYYSVFVTDQSEFTETRWVFYFDLVDEEPSSSDTVVTGPPASLSETDRRLFERAHDAVRAHADVYDVDDEPLQGRGPDFHQELDPEASALVPDAPFDYLKHRGQYLVPRAERGPVDLTRYTFGIEQVASSRAELEEHVASTVVDTTFDSAEESPAVELVDEVTDLANGRIHTEKSEDGSMSDGLAAVTERLGMAPHMPETVSEYTSFSGAHFAFDGEWYRATFSLGRVF